MTCRDEILVAVAELVGTGVDPFTLNNVIEVMRRNRSRYKESTISTHVTSRMCANAPANHAVVYDDLI